MSRISELYKTTHNGTEGTTEQVAAYAAILDMGVSSLALDTTSTTSVSAFLETAYQTAFGRSVDADGIAAYTAKLTDGTITKAAFMEILLAGAEVYPATGAFVAFNTADKALVVKVAEVAATALTNNLSATDAKDILATVVDGTATVTSANNAVVVTADANAVSAYNNDLTAYNTAVTVAATSKAAADAAALTVSTVALATASQTAANTAKTDADAVVTAAALLVTDAAATATTTDDSTAAAYKTIADAAATTAATLVTTATAAVSTTTAAAAAAAAIGSTYTLTDARDILTSLTTKSDTVNGTYGTVNATDIILDTSTVDNDTANLVIASATAVTIANIENVNLDIKATGVVTATNFSGVKTLSVDSNYAVTTYTVNNLTSGVKVAVDSTATTLGLDMYLAAGGTSSNADAVTVSLAGGVTVTTFDKDNGLEDVDALTFYSTGSTVNTITLVKTDDYVDTTTSHDSVAITGDRDIILKLDQSGTDGFDGATVTTSMTNGATSTLNITSALLATATNQIDYDSVSVSKIKLTAATANIADIKLKDGSTVEVAKVGGATITAALTLTDATAGGTLNFNANAAEAASSGLLFAEAGTVNIANTSTAAVSFLEAITTSYAGVGHSTDVTVAVGEGLTLLSLAAAGGSTLDAVTVTGTGDKDFATTGTSAFNSLSVNIQGDASLDKITVSGVASITAVKTVTLQEVEASADNLGSLTVSTGGAIALQDNIGAAATEIGNVSITSTATSIATTATTGTINSNGTILLDAATTISVGDAANIAAVGNITYVADTTISTDSNVTSSTGNVSMTAGTSVSLLDTTSGNITASAGNISIVAGTSITTADNLDITATLGSITLTAGTTITSATTAAITAAQNVTISGTSLSFAGAIVGTAGTVTLTGSSTTVDSVLSAAITGSAIVFAGSGHTFGDNANDTLTGNVTVNTGVNLVLDNGTSEIVGNLTVAANSIVTLDVLTGNLIADSATKAITIASTGTTTTSIVSGSGDDSITTGDIEATINAGAGNDTISGAVVTSAGNQLNINGGAGVDTITGGAALDDILTGGTGSDTFIYTDIGAAAAQGSYAEKITDFTVGAAGDTLNVTKAGATTTITSNGTSVTFVDTTDAVLTTHAETNIYVMTGKAFADEAAMMAAMNDATTGIGAPAAAAEVLVVWADTDGSSYVTTMGGNVGNTAFEAGENIVQLTGLTYTNLAGLTEDNFICA